MDEAKDIAEPVELPQVDEPPKSGVWLDPEGALTEEEAERGRLLGEAIDPDDDTDNGLD
jgi:hypothetical protein